MIDSNNMAEMMKDISIYNLDPYRKMVKNTKTGAYIICNNSTNEVESKGVINPNPNPPPAPALSTSIKKVLSKIILLITALL